MKLTERASALIMDESQRILIIAPPFSTPQLIVKRRTGGHGTSLKKSNLREDPIPPLPFALISLPESESESENMKR